MGIDRKEIVDAALSVLDELGIDKLSTRALAARLGVAQPALYWHFRNKDELLDALGVEILARHHTHRVPGPRQRWDAFTLANARSFRKALLAVRDGARIIAGNRPTQGQFGEAEQQLRLYVDAGFTAEAALYLSITVARYVVGFVLEEQAEHERDDSHEMGDLAAELASFPLLDKVVTPRLRAGTLNSEPVFEGGLGFLLAGFRARLAGRD
jgi:TetR/AcrR family tetracycline transcriptional repressor